MRGSSSRISESIELLMLFALITYLLVTSSGGGAASAFGPRFRSLYLEAYVVDALPK
jgi:hypothetical protein